MRLVCGCVYVYVAHMRESLFRFANLCICMQLVGTCACLHACSDVSSSPKTFVVFFMTHFAANLTGTYTNVRCSSLKLSPAKFRSFRNWYAALNRKCNTIFITRAIKNSVYSFPRNLWNYFKHPLFFFIWKYSTNIYWLLFVLLIIIMSPLRAYLTVRITLVWGGYDRFSPESSQKLYFPLGSSMLCFHFD